MHTIGIIGFGEIGQALSKVYQEKNFTVKVFDPYVNKKDDLVNVDFLNICFPYNEEFVDQVNKYISEFKPKITIVHSTIAPGTTKKLFGKVCHSPIRGLHPNLEGGIKTFLKYIGSEDASAAEMYKNHLDSIGINSFVCKSSLISEFAKLLDTTYYGLCIAYHNDVSNICKKYQLDFDEVMTIYNETYNRGYKNLGKENVIRPVLKPGTKIGGHCIIPNAKILKNFFYSGLLDEILKYE